MEGWPLSGIRTGAFDDPRFEPERLRSAARSVLAPLTAVTSDNELIPQWREVFGRWLPAGWRRHRLAGGWGAEVVIRDLEIITVRNVGAAEPGEAVIRVRLRVKRWPRLPLLGPFVRAFPRRSLVVWLTLMAPPGADWEFIRADFGPAGEYHLEAEVVPEPARDPALRDAVIHELAEGDSVAGSDELVIRTEGEAARRLLDLSLTDGRYAPAVVEASVRSLIRAWRRFAIGDEDGYHAFAALSSYEVAE